MANPLQAIQVVVPLLLLRPRRLVDGLHRGAVGVGLSDPLLVGVFGDDEPFARGSVMRSASTCALPRIRAALAAVAGGVRRLRAVPHRSAAARPRPGPARSRTNVFVGVERWRVFRSQAQLLAQRVQLGERLL